VRTLWLLRHAKAVAHSPEDHERRLAPRGRRQCAELAEHLAGCGRTPTLVLSSSARRATETARLVLAGLEPHAEVVVEPALYEAGVDDVLEVVRTRSGDRAEVMVVGHNPTFEELACALVGDDDPAGRRRLAGGLPTCALAVVSFEAGGWAEVGPGGGRLVELFVPGAR
jgi:phosphohistidine phosphatase